MPDAFPGDELQQINVKVTKSFLGEMDDTWQDHGFTSRSEFIRHVLHDAVELPTFDRDELLAIALAERAISEDGPLMSREEVLEEYDIDVEEQAGTH